MTVPVKNNDKHLVLLVEDQSAASDMLKQVLIAKWHLHVDTAKTYQEAKDLLKKHRHQYLVAICDLNLPDAPNGEILDLVERAEVRIIALTGMLQRQLTESLTQSKLIDYVLKNAPNSIQYVVNLVGRLYKNQQVKVIIADDSVLALSLLAEIMNLLNFKVIKAENGVDALNLLKENLDTRLLITDHEMPEMNGFDLVINARKLLDKNHLAIIGLSSNQQYDLGANFIKNGANDFLSKPYAFEELLCRVNMNMEALDNLDYIRELAYKDSLTKLYNRHFFFERAHQIISDAKKQHQLSTIAILDIDFFKKINDQYGHDGGDQALRHFSELIKNNLSGCLKNCLIARFGGEEFVVLIQNTPLEIALEKLNQFRQVVQQMSLQWQGNTIRVTVSIGAVNGVINNLDAAIKCADENLYEAKQQGRNQVLITSS